MGVLHQFVCRTGKYFSNFNVLIIVVLCAAQLLCAQSRSYVVRIESFKDDDKAVVLSQRNIEPGSYTVIFRSREIGTIQIHEVERSRRFDGFSFSCLADITDLKKTPAIVSGSRLVLNPPPTEKLPSYRDSFGNDYREYKKTIISPIDAREMVLVEGGVSLIGSDIGDDDEKPVHKRKVDTFYIDRYEVSNKDYLHFMMESGHAPPRSWESGHFPAGKALHPVIVTYYEAGEYAAWAGKRLPTEFEWERAANGVIASKKTVTEDGMIEIPYKTRYPWGNDITNQTQYSRNFDDKQDMPSDTALITDGTVSVVRFEETDISYYGAVHMAGNIAEWTSSWYTGYEGNRTENIRYGTQVKVIRGGAWYNTAEKCTITSRAFGGLPNLETDSSAGFRCVHDIDANYLMEVKSER